ncbi:Uncharacterised protein [Bordetella pertussis]|nr:Uncharacterised protein [Bordetella pertussis]
MPPPGSMPRACRSRTTSSEHMISLTAAFSSSSTWVGVPLGAIRPFHPRAVRSG